MTRHVTNIGRPPEARRPTVAPTVGFHHIVLLPRASSLLITFARAFSLFRIAISIVLTVAPGFPRCYQFFAVDTFPLTVDNISVLFAISLLSILFQLSSYTASGLPTIMSQTRTCTKCGHSKPIELFQKQSKERINNVRVLKTCEPCRVSDTS